jgi:hypothetical protein
MMAVEEWSYPDTVFSCDACLEGLGGISLKQFCINASLVCPEFKI